MNLLVIGGCHAVGHGLTPGQSFVEQFVRRLKRTGRVVSVDYYAPLTIQETTDLLPRLSLNQYQLILLELGQYELTAGQLWDGLFSGRQNRPDTDAPVGLANGPLDLKALHELSPLAPAPYRGGMRHWLREQAGLILLSALGHSQRLPHLKRVEHQLLLLLQQLYHYRHKVLLLTPFPSRDPVSRQMRLAGQPLFRQVGLRIGINVIDIQPLIEAREEYFLNGSREYLNAGSHELIGSSLYEYYRSELLFLLRNTPNPQVE